MQGTLYAAVAIGALIAVGGPGSKAPAVALRAPSDTGLAAKLVGKWDGTRFDSSATSGRKFTMTWKQDTTSALIGTVTMVDGSSYPVRVVWSSDTGFVTESAPHQSPGLKEEVVTRTVSHLKGDSLWGAFEARPMSYQGRTEQGHFSAHKG
jgi:hypothetical protein